MLHNEHIQNNWPRIKIQVLSKWNKLTEADVEKTEGDPIAMHQLVNSKYGNIPDFDKTYKKICESCTPSSRNTYKNDIENRSETAPAGEAGLHVSGTEMSNVNTEASFHSGYPEAWDELPHYSPNSPSHSNFVQFENENDNNTHFTTPDEFTTSQDPTPSREDITLGRITSSATQISTAKAASNSSVVPSDDVTRKKKI